MFDMLVISRNSNRIWMLNFPPFKTSYCASCLPKLPSKIPNNTISWFPRKKHLTNVLFEFNLHIQISIFNIFSNNVQIIGILLPRSARGLRGALNRRANPMSAIYWTRYIKHCHCWKKSNASRKVMLLFGYLYIPWD